MILGRADPVFALLAERIGKLAPVIAANGGGDLLGQLGNPLHMDVVAEGGL